ncbi:S-methyl-5-thioribose-1-phosphate isomerase [bacterium]|nr:S-methyl-5-thioribose-1-phosphate isomerase [bacterium]
MRDVAATSIRVTGGILFLLDQQRLPHEEEWVACREDHEVLEAITQLKVRGAPAIAVAAALYVATQIARGLASREETRNLLQLLRSSRPTAVNLMHALDGLEQLLPEDNWQELLQQEALRIFAQDVQLCEEIAVAGLTVLSHGSRILTHCNTGSLATAGRGTALGICTKAHEAGMDVQVWVDETRPLLQGGRLTAWELEKSGVPYALICDNMAGALMARGEVDCIIVGADRIAANGDFANKIGTYSLAVLAQYHKIPFYVAAPRTTVDMECSSGVEIPIEQRHEDEVRGFAGAVLSDGAPKRGSFLWSKQSAPVSNPAFDVTPAALITGWILDGGVVLASEEGRFELPPEKHPEPSGGAAEWAPPL